MKKSEKQTLKIVIKGEWFDQIAAKKKKIEYREIKPHWESRLYASNGKKREFDFIEFINGYNSDARRMIAKFEGFDKKGGLYNIRIGKIIRKFRN